jgi:hypothetical protein
MQPRRRIIHSDVLLAHLADLASAFGIVPEGAIPYPLIVKAVESVRAAMPFDDVVDEWTICDVLRCTRPTLRGYVEMGLPVIRLGMRKWYSLVSVENWLRSHERSAEPRRTGRPASRPPVRRRDGAERAGMRNRLFRTLEIGAGGWTVPGRIARLRQVRFDDQRFFAGGMAERRSKAGGPDRKTSFVLLVYPFDSSTGRCNYISNGAYRRVDEGDDRALRRPAGTDWRGVNARWPSSSICRFLAV